MNHKGTKGTKLFVCLALAALCLCGNFFFFLSSVLSEKSEYAAIIRTKLNYLNAIFANFSNQGVIQGKI